MTDPISTFFEAWQLDDGAARLAKVTSAVAANIYYADPRTPNAITSIEALNEYLGMFSANAPGWGAKVVASAETHGITRATVAFGGPGPDGETITQLGQYFVEKDGGLSCRMIGFVGIGEPE